MPETVNNLRYGKLDSRPYVFEDPGRPTQTATLKAPSRQNQYRGTLSGPVQILKILNGKNRLLFMASYEGFKSRHRSQATSAPAPAMRCVRPRDGNVDFSTMKDFKLCERHTLQFRIGMFNAPNHPAWGRPKGAWGALYTGGVDTLLPERDPRVPRSTTTD